VRDDVQDAVNLRLGLPNIMDSVSDEIGPEFYLQRVFNVGSVASKTLILQLAGREPRSFLSGSRIELDVVLSEPNRKEYHHCYPKAFLAREGLELGGISPSALANYAFLNRAENREISDRAPSVYRAQMPADVGQICASQLLPESLFRDDWLVFIEQRANLLAEDARSLMNQGL
jgi:hypothetical protein